MRRLLVGMMASAALVAPLAAGAADQETSATIRTHQGILYKVADPSLEVFYTIGEPKEKKEEPQSFAPTINVTTSIAAPGGPGEAGDKKEEKEEKLLRGHARADGITVSREGVERQIYWDRIRTLFFTPKPVVDSGLPPYVTHYRYAVSVTLVDGERVDADYVNLGGAIFRGTTPDGRIDLPWQDVQSVIFER
jgi:hypothetical protein